MIDLDVVDVAANLPASRPSSQFAPFTELILMRPPDSLRCPRLLRLLERRRFRHIRFS